MFMPLVAKANCGSAHAAKAPENKICFVFMA
jgi:hypothetical protein